LAVRLNPRTIAAKITPETALHFSMAAYENASRLVDAAVALHARELHGPARSMAISAREELGKHFAAILYVAGQYDAARFASQVWGHNSKQTLGAIVTLLSGTLKDQSRHLEPALKLEGSTVREAFALMSPKLQAATNEMPMPDKEAIDSIEATVGRAHSGEDDARRTEGLYVDLVESGNGLDIRSPTAVTDAQAAEEIGVTRGYLDWAAQLMNAMGSEQLTDAAQLTIQEAIAELKGLADVVIPKTPGGA
jgi:AbiV family abortive infection protein